MITMSNYMTLSKIKKMINQIRETFPCLHNNFDMRELSLRSV